MRSLVIGIALTWMIALFMTMIAGYASAWPLALFVGGSPARGWAIGGVVAGIASSIWALRTSRSLVRDHAARHDTFRAPWPASSRQALAGLGLLDRRGQPGARAIDSGDVVARLQGGERHERSVRISQPGVWYLAVAGPTGMRARMLTTDDDIGVEAHAGQDVERASLMPGLWRVVVDRPGNAMQSASDVHAWWVQDSAR